MDQELNVLGVVKPEYELVTKEMLIQAFPEKSKTITQELVDAINEAQADPQFDVLTLFNQMISHKDILNNSSGSMTDYINALKFCSYLEACDDNYTQAYIKTFIHRAAVKDRMFEPTHSSKYKELTHMSSQYRKLPMVIAILTMSDAPLRLLTRGMQIKALGVLNSEMDSAFKSIDRITAADKLLVHTRALEEGKGKIEINIGANKDSKAQFGTLINTLGNVAAQQLELLQAGYSIADVQRLNLKKEEFEEAELDD